MRKGKAQNWRPRQFLKLRWFRSLNDVKHNEQLHFRNSKVKAKRNTPATVKQSPALSLLRGKRTPCYQDIYRGLQNYAFVLRARRSLRSLALVSTSSFAASIRRALADVYLRCNLMMSCSGQRLLYEYNMLYFFAT